MISNNSADNTDLVSWWQERDDPASTVTELLNALAGRHGTDQMADAEFWSRARQLVDAQEDVAPPS